MTRTLAAALPALALTLTASAQNPPPTCPAPPHTQVVRSIHNLPVEIRSALLAKTPDIVDSNQPFDATDVVMQGAHFNRFAFAWHGNSRWLVATEHGGIAYNNPIYILVQPASPATNGTLTTYPAQIVATTSSRPSTVCADAERILQEKLPTQPPVKPLSATHG